MTEQEKISVVEDILEVEPGTLSLNCRLEDIDEWDSLAIISLLAYFDTEFDKKLTSKDIKAMIYVKDIIEMM